MASRRQSLKALAKERGCVAAVWNAGPPLWDGYACDEYGNLVVDVRAPTRRATLAGLRAALESMPLKRKGRT